MRRSDVYFVDPTDPKVPPAGTRAAVCRCGGCGGTFLAERRRRWCSDACRKKDQRQRGTA